MKRTIPVVAVLVLVAVAVWQPWAGPGIDTAISTETVTAPGYRISVDPATGQLSEEAPPPVDMKDLPESLRNALDTSSEGLEVVSSPVSGDMINLQGRFQSTSVARINADGTLEAPCLTNEAELDAFVKSDDTTNPGEEE